MYKVDDLIIYSTHGLCRINEITEKTYGETTKDYYVLQPLTTPKVSINVPIKIDKVQFLDIVNAKEAAKIIELFKAAYSDDLERNFQRNDNFLKFVNEGNRSELVKIISILLQRQRLRIQDNKKLPIQDAKSLSFLQGILYTELSVSLDLSVNEITDRINNQVFHTA